MMGSGRTCGVATLDRASRTWWLETTADVAVRAKRIFPRIPVEAHGRLPLADNARNATELKWFLERFQMQMSEADRAHLDARAAAVVEQETVVDRILGAGYVPREFPLLKPLRPYQAVAVELVLRTGALLCADDTGLGKTVVGCGVMSDPRTRPALVLCPTHLPSQWEAKIREFLGHDLLVHILEKGTPYDLIERCGRMPDILISNFAKFTNWSQTLADAGVNGLVVDEGHRFRHADTQRYEAMLYLRDRVPYRIFLTATPIINYGDETHTVLTALQEDCLGTREEFMREHCGGSTAKKAKVEDPAALNADLRRRGLMVRRTRKDVGRELPPVNSIVHVLDVENGSALAEAEASLASLAEVLCADGTRGIEKLKAAGEFDLRVRQATGIDKAPFAAKFIRMLCAQGQKVLAFAWHRSVYDILMEALGPGQKDRDEELPDLHPVLYTGSETAKQKDASRDRFVSGDSQVMLVSLRSGEGIDGLQHVCSTTVHIELDFSPQIMKQNVDRVNRDGQREPVFAYVLLSPEGSDPVIADILGVKAGQFDGIFNGTAAEVEEQGGVPVDRVKQVAKAFLEQQKAKKARAAEPPNPKANAPTDLRPTVAQVAKPPPRPAEPPKPPVDRWVDLPAKSVDAKVEKMLIEAKVGASASTVQDIRRHVYRAKVGFAGASIVALKLEKVN